MSTSRSNSVSSFDSIGIGSTDTSQQDVEDAGFMKTTEDMRLFDCIVYLMYCFGHHKIALAKMLTTSNRSRNNKKNFLWLPFVLLKDGQTWEQTAKDGAAMLLLGGSAIGTSGSKNVKQDDEIDVLKTGKLPKMEISPLNFLRIQMPNDRYYIRYTNFVNIQQTDDSNSNNSANTCFCEENNPLTWVFIRDIFQDQISNLWGPEVKEFAKMLINDHSLQFIHEKTFDDVLMIMNDENYGEFLLSNQIDSNFVLVIYEQFIEHCYPSMYMSLESFKRFMFRFGGFARNNDSHHTRLVNLFKAFPGWSSGFIDFNDFLIGIICMEPNTDPMDPNRLQLIYRYYDFEQISINLKDLIQDLHSNEPNNSVRIKNMADAIMPKVKDIEHVSYEQFEQIVQSNLLKGLEKQFRSPKSIIEQIGQTIKTKIERQRKPSPRISASSQEIKMKDRGICNGCKAHKYQYDVHCVSFDANGRCVKPLRLYDVKIEEPITPALYSAEHVFGMNTISRNILDIVRKAYQKNEPFMTSPDESNQGTFRAFRTLCEIVSHLLMCEEKLLKIQAPVLVVGSIQGKLEALMSLEKVFWPNVPVLTTNIVFLGNYIGNTRNNIEVLCYLLALKVSSPNKVFLLRGWAETMENSKDLQSECIQKYGSEGGKLVWQEFNKVFNRLPAATIIDEQIFCVHSGIPKASTQLLKFMTIPDYLVNVAKDCPLVYDMIRGQPTPSSDKANMNDPVPDHQPSALTTRSMKIIKIKNTPKETKERKGTMNDFNFNSFYQFMQANNLQFMIRSIVSSPTTIDGYRLYFDSRCISIGCNCVEQNQQGQQQRFSIVVQIDPGNEEIRLIKVQHHSTATGGQTFKSKIHNNF